jgi:DNA-binding protein HU-beta
MIKKDLIVEIMNSTNLSKVDSFNVINSFISIVKKTLSKGENVTLIGFGTFVVKTRIGRKVTVPNTEIVVKIKNKKVIKFVSGKSFNEQVNKKTKN